MNQVQQFFEYIFNALKIWIIVQPWESGLRVRNGKHVKKLTKGIYFRIPYFDSLYIQENRLRVSELSMQTVTSKDLKTITLNCSFGYSVQDIEKLYDTLFHPESTLKNMINSEIATFAFTKNLSEITPKELEVFILGKLSEMDYGLKFEHFKMINFAVVKTFRLIKDESWTNEGLNMNKKK
mgnify:CR=1 FL=1